MSNVFEVNLTVDLDKVLAGAPIYDDDGSIVGSGQTTLEAVILDRVVGAIVRKIVAGDTWTTISRQVTKVRDEVVRERVVAEVDALLDKEVQRTDLYGNPQGEPVSLREEVVGMVNTWLTRKTSDARYGSAAGSRTEMARIVEETITSDVKRELKTALEEGKEKVKQQLAEESAQMFSAAMARVAAQR